MAERLGVKGQRVVTGQRHVCLPVGGQVRHDDGFGVCSGGQALGAGDQVARLRGKEVQPLVVGRVEKVVRGDGGVSAAIARQIGGGQHVGPTAHGHGGVGAEVGER